MKSTLLTGVDAPTAKKSYFKMSKKPQKHILCSFTKFRKKKISFVACVKKAFFGAPKYLFCVPFYYFFTQATKKSFPRKTLWVNIKYSDIHPASNNE
jgi:hypothetical protein